MFEVCSAVKIHVVVTWSVMSCSPVYGYELYEEPDISFFRKAVSTFQTTMPHETQNRNASSEISFPYISFDAQFSIHILHVRYASY
jgi:hypothetical protein